MKKTASPATFRKAALALSTFALVTASAVGLLGYVLSGPKWPTTEKLYYVNPANLDVTESAASAAVQMGASAWSRDSNAAFAFAYAGPTTASAVANDRTNNVFFRSESNGSTIAVCYYWYSGSQLLDADIMFYDGAFTFVAGTSGCSGGMFIEDVATHEFGHALGLGHTNVSNATMYPSIPYCNQDRRYLDPDDVAGVEALYPPAGTSPSAPTNAQATISGVSDRPASRRGRSRPGSRRTPRATWPPGSARTRRITSACAPTTAPATRTTATLPVQRPRRRHHRRRRQARPRARRPPTAPPA